MQIATNVKALREQKGLSQEDLAKKAGISRSAIANIESNQNFMGFETALKLSDALGITCEELAYGKAEQKKLEN